MQLSKTIRRIRKMTTSSVKIFLLILIAAVVVKMPCALPAASQHRVTKLNGCELLSNASKYNGKLVQIYGLVHSDYEHFDLRFKCKGYIQLETSTTEADLKKFGFKTLEDDKYKEFLKSVESKDAIGPNCLQCSSKKNTVHATVEGLFRCHYDFPDCSKVSKQGESSLVIASIKLLRIEIAEPSNPPN
jgi:hypothetical protein